MVKPYFDFFSVKPWRERVACAGPLGVPRGSLNLMEVLQESHIPPSSRRSPHGAAVSWSPPRGDSETECWLEALGVDAPEAVERDFLNLQKMPVNFFIAEHSKNNALPGLLTDEKFTGAKSRKD